MVEASHEAHTHRTQNIAVLHSNQLRTCWQLIYAHTRTPYYTRARRSDLRIPFVIIASFPPPLPQRQKNKQQSTPAFNCLMLYDKCNKFSAPTATAAAAAAGLNRTCFARGTQRHITHSSRLARIVQPRDNLHTVCDDKKNMPTHGENAGRLMCRGGLSVSWTLARKRST